MHRDRLLDTINDSTNSRYLARLALARSSLAAWILSLRGLKKDDALLKGLDGVVFIFLIATRAA